MNLHTNMAINKLTLPIISLAATCAAADDFDVTALDRLPGMGAAAPVLGSNIEGGSVFANYIDLRNNGQFFLAYEGLFQLESPGMPALPYTSVRWCSNIEFTDIEGTNPYVGYTANCVYTPLGDAIAVATEAGAQLTMPDGLDPDQFVATNSLSMVYVPQTNQFEGVMHKNSDNLVARFWDDGRSTMHNIVWELFDEGDPHPNAATTSLVAAARYTWVTADVIAAALNRNATAFTPEAFEKIYADVWALNPIHAEVLAATKRAGEETVDSESDDSEDEESATSGGARKLASLAIVTILLALFQ